MNQTEQNQAESTYFKDKLYQLMESRRSIRAYQNREVPRELVEKILAAAMSAPSGKNRQNWRFFIVQGEKRNEYLKYSQKSWLGIKDILKERLKPSLYDFTERFFYTLGQAPVIVFCYSHNSSDEKHLTSIGSVYMAVQNLNLAACSEGLGTCTMGAPLEIENEVNQFLGVTDKNLQLLCAVVLGYPDHQPPKPPKQIEGRITWV